MHSLIISKSAKTKTQWVGFWGGDDDPYCAFPDTLASLEGHAPIPIPICPPNTKSCIRPWNGAHCEYVVYNVWHARKIWKLEIWWALLQTRNSCEVPIEMARVIRHLTSASFLDERLPVAATSGWFSFSSTSTTPSAITKTMNKVVFFWTTTR